MTKKIILISLFILSSCSIEKIAIKKTSNIIDQGMTSIFKEEDIQYVKEAMPANLELIEILIANHKDDKLLLNAAIGFCGYAWAYLEDYDNQRASYFYQKGIAYSNMLMEKKKITDSDNSPLKKEDAKVLFWNTFCKSGLVNINRDKPEILASLSEIEEQSLKISKIEPNYFYNSNYTLLASYYASKPEMLGGNFKKSKELFEKAITENGKDFLLNYLMYAKTYAVMTQNKKLFDELIEKIENFEIQKDEKTFFNKIAIEKSRRLKEKENELFEEN